MIDETPAMIPPFRTDAPALDVIVTLCGTSASLLENAILNALSAGALMVAGENAKSFASRARINGAAVGPGDGVRVGFGLGVGVGVGFGFGVGDSAGVGVGFGVGYAAVVGVATGSMLAVGSAWELAEGAELAGVPDRDGDAAIVAVGSVATSFGPAEGDPTARGPGGDAPQAATRRPTAISRNSRTMGTAAL